MSVAAWPDGSAELLRPLLVAVPALLVTVLARRYRLQPRMLVAALFSLLFLCGTLPVLHLLAEWLGWWHAHTTLLVLLGLPADLWLGWALLWGPVVFLAFPRVPSWWLAIVAAPLNLLTLLGLAPLVQTGPGAAAGMVLAIVFLLWPAQQLARWTADDRRLPWRATLLAIAYGGVAFLLLPSAIMKAMGGSWTQVLLWPAWVLVPALLMLAICIVVGLSAVQLFVLHGEGTPIPLDHTRRLVRTGLYAYLTNPMQACTALAWLVLGLLLRNAWVALAAVMAVVFVQGLVRWHHRLDLAVRFPQGWSEYRQHVPDWWPRRQLWAPAVAIVRCDPRRWRHWPLRWIARRTWPGLRFEQGEHALYLAPEEGRAFHGLAVLAKALNHAGFAAAVVGAGLLLVALPCQAFASALARPTLPASSQ